LIVPTVLQRLPRDGWLLFATRFIRLFALINLPFFIAGTLKITYDVLLYWAFATLHPPEEMRTDRALGER